MCKREQDSRQLQDNIIVESKLGYNILTYFEIPSYTHRLCRNVVAAEVKNIPRWIREHLTSFAPRCTCVRNTNTAELVNHSRFSLFFSLPPTVTGLESVCAGGVVRRKTVHLPFLEVVGDRKSKGRRSGGSDRRSRETRNDVAEGRCVARSPSKDHD